jgi:hypothetical protein
MPAQQVVELRPAGSIEVHDLAIENGLTGQHSAMPSQSVGKDW